MSQTPESVTHESRCNPELNFLDNTSMYFSWPSLCHCTHTLEFENQKNDRSNLPFPVFVEFTTIKQTFYHSSTFLRPFYAAFFFHLHVIHKSPSPPPLALPICRPVIESMPCTCLQVASLQHIEFIWNSCRTRTQSALAKYTSPSQAHSTEIFPS